MKSLFELIGPCQIDVSHLDLRNGMTNEPLGELTFHKVDGMYSICTNKNGETIHLSATTKVKEIK